MSQITAAATGSAGAHASPMTQGSRQRVASQDLGDYPDWDLTVRMPHFKFFS